ncbi:DUF3048 domain-containing protein [Microbacteriaceae bacterium]|nr:DUF3048 domain-containing protein [Candidatus Saccharibacteria bacterium]
MKVTFRPHHLFSRFHDWVHVHRTRTYLFAGIGIVVAAGLIASVALYKAPVKEVSKPKSTTKIVKKADPVFYSPLTGVKVANQEATKQALTAIMIENSPDARPQSGVKDAGVIYEAVAEGGITRFLTLHQEDKPQLIGPVRSVRMYYVDWLAPYQASVAHVGGSAASLAEVRNGNYRDIDQFFNAGTYWRASDRYAPHNVYTSFEKIDALNQSKGYTESTFTSFARVDGKPAATPNATSIAMNFSSALYNTQYAYDAASNTYLRSIGGVPSDDREKGRIAPSSVVAIKVAMTHVLEDGYRESIQTSGTGAAYVFQNGTVTEATWRKNDRSSPLELIDASGKPISLIRGQTWIGAIPNGSGSVSWT